MKMTLLQLAEINALALEHNVSVVNITECRFPGELQVEVGKAVYQIDPNRGWTRIDLRC